MSQALPRENGMIAIVLGRCSERSLARFLAAIIRAPRFVGLGVTLFAAAFTGGQALAQTSGCSRCPNEPSRWADVPELGGANGQRAIVRRISHREASRHEWRRPRMALAAAGGSYTVCVRTCDGSFFPVSYFGAASRSETLENVCQSLCPNTTVELYSFPFGGTIDEAVSFTGEPYANLPNAHKFEQSYDSGCSCRRPGQSWADALASAEAKYGHRSHDIVVTPEKSEELSRPIEDPRAKGAGPMDANPAPTVDTADPPPLNLDPEGVDTTLSVAASKIGHESSGIKDEDSQMRASFGLNQGQIQEETGPDGSTRRVRILPQTF
jgi:hypothetical protein